jgi:hypothetical protein
MVETLDINTALEEVRNTESPNYAAIADKHGVHRSTLSRRARGVTRSREEFTSDELKLLTNGQEEVLLNNIDRLDEKGLFITPRILRSIVEELVGHSIGKNWVYNFVDRYSKRITTPYLKGFDRDRQIADNPITIRHFFTNVSYHLARGIDNTNEKPVTSYGPET